MNNKRLGISIIASIIAFGTNMVIGFFLTPYIVNRVGAEAYGFVTLANNFTNYAQILSVALNSMAGRFITIAYHKGNQEEASQYFSSVIYGNIILAIIFVTPMIICIFFLDSFLNIDPQLINDVEFLFAFIFASFLISLINAAYSTSTFVANRIDLSARRSIESYIIKAVVLFVLFFAFKPRVAYVGISTMASILYSLAANIRYTKILTPNIKVGIRLLSVKKIWELLKSGMWNSINKLSYVLSEGLDLLITNIFIDAKMMGVLAIAKMLPGVIATMIGTIAGVFAPGYTISYAKENKEDLLVQIRKSMIILSVVSNSCLSALVVVGRPFFKLWVPNQDAEILQLLSVVTVAGLAVNGGLQCIFNIFTITNKIRANSLMSILSSAINITVVFVLLKFTDLGVFAVAGVSTATTILRNLLFSIPYAAHCIKVDFRTFYVPVFTNLAVLIITSVIGTIIASFFVLNSWIRLMLFGVIFGACEIIVNVLVVTNRAEKSQLLTSLFGRIR